MFRRLRNRFLILNMAIISVLLMGAFSMVYAFTYNSIQRSIDIRLFHTLEPGRDSGRGAGQDADSRQAGPNPQGPPGDPAGNRPFELTPDFVLETDAQGAIQRIDSGFEIEEAVYRQVAALALASEAEKGNLRFENTSWAFRRIPLKDGGHRIAFLDISREKGMLRVLILTLLTVGSLMLVLIFLISRLFANRSIRPIEDAWEKQKQFVSDASHELKTPLTTINANLDVLMSHPDSRIAEEEKWLSYIRSEAQRMTRLTNDLLCLTRLDSGRDDPARTLFSMSETVQTVLLGMEAVLYEKNLTLSEDLQESLYLTGNPDQMKQLVVILLDNAVKYTPQGGKVTVRLWAQEKRLFFSVSNTGPPIPAELREKLFDRFYRAEQSRSRQGGGYGLGLAIAKSICARHGAQISVSSQNGENTFLTVFAHKGTVPA